MTKNIVTQNFPIMLITGDLTEENCSLTKKMFFRKVGKSIQFF